jgi:hypothetical protein
VLFRSPPAGRKIPNWSLLFTSLIKIFTDIRKLVMKKNICVVLLVLISTVVNAQNYGFDIMVRGGVGIPETPSSYPQSWLQGPHFEGGFEFTLSQPLSVGLIADYCRNDINTNHAVPGAVPADARWSGGVMDIFSLSVFVDYRLAGRVGGVFPYVIIDAGMTHLKSSQLQFASAGINEALPSSSETGLRSSGGLGHDIPMTANVCFSLTGKYVYVFTKNGGTGFVPIDAGFKMVF